ncbi:MAG: carboxy terminal-processing peptidase [Bacteroidetes bacterium]|nr:carboxy terminal-processing peptidase [Bacteroidota bacterium]
MRYTKITVFAVLLSVLGLFAFRSVNQEQAKDEVIMKLIVQGINSSHYAPFEIDDTFSKNVFKLYIDRLDYSKRYFTVSDIENLREQETKIDDQIKDGSYAFFDKADELYANRMAMVKGFYKEILTQPFDFNVDESIELKADEMPWAKDEKELKERWRKLLKFNVLSRLYTELDLQEKTESNPAGASTKTMAELEQDARVKVMKTYDDWSKRMDKMDQDDRRSMFLNVITNIYDPHTGYFPPADKENFDIQMSGQLEGIGATLQEKDGYIQVAAIVPGSACYRQGELAEDDIILKVAQGKEEPVDIVDMRVDDAVKYIRGPKGTEVRLTVKKTDGSTKIISIIRDIVVLEETYARSAIIKNSYTNKGVGYIKLPKFYADFSNKNGRTCAKDVRIEVEKLKAQGMDGLVIDLRNNGGGSLMDVVEMAGLFVDQGPMVQVRNRYGAPQVLEDSDPKTLYDGPLVILVNSSSASASEIMAAAIQDYKRGIIVGTPTFGKGTVQRFFDLDNLLRGENELKPLGSIKLTTQKFYRINGGATQLKGVTPDVILPDAYTYVDRGEKEQEHVMPWDEIEPALYNPWKLTASDYAKIRKESRERITKDPLFQIAEDNAQRLKTQRDEQLQTLKLDAYRAEEKKLKEESDAYKNAFKPIKGVSVVNLPADLTTINSDTVRVKMNKEWIEGLQKDIYINEACAIIKDLR